MQIDFENLSKTSILDEKLYEEIFLNTFDAVDRERLVINLLQRAKQLKVRSDVDRLCKCYERDIRESERAAKADKLMKEKAEKAALRSDDGTTDFDFFGNGVEFRCGQWRCDSTGVRYYNMFYREVKACAHPILPIGRVKNLETGEEQIELAWFNDGKWHTNLWPRLSIASGSKIVGALASKGISVNDTNKTDLIKYLGEMLDMNPELIKISTSTAKMGWHDNGTEFVPYDDKIMLETDRFKSIADSIREEGSEEAWYDIVKKIRAEGRIEVKMILAASFASVLVSRLDVIPFFVDLWGQTENGKTVSLMIAASVWANPRDNAYIGDYKTTDVALEAKADFLNNLPMILDDTSKATKRISENFENIVYDLTYGKGKSRSNKELGVNRENTWRNCIITNGEKRLSSYVTQGGAINRVLEIECPKKIFEHPQEIVEVIKSNYGFAGRQFVEVIKNYDKKELKKLYKSIFNKLMDGSDFMQKQAQSLAVVLTADAIITEHIFEDGNGIKLEDAKELLTRPEEISDNQRAYNEITAKIAMNKSRFDDESPCEKWGIIDETEGYAILMSPAFKKLCSEAGTDEKSFLSWAKRQNLIQYEQGRLKKQKKINSIKQWCVYLKLDDSSTKDEFMPVPPELTDDSFPF